ncbi:uncharacterized protein [Coffea arabica]|uniref:Uncharacterized protein isoform X1 n=1 Tax=Coffea arabica TaxID=13443 RepID=A0ABM4UWW3_COFAR
MLIPKQLPIDYAYFNASSFVIDGFTLFTFWDLGYFLCLPTEHLRMFFSRSYSWWFNLRFGIAARKSSRWGFWNKLLAAILQRKMDSNLVRFYKINPELSDWTTIGQVLDKQKPQISRKGTSYQKLVFVDAEGRKAQAMIYGGDIHFFKRHFQPFRRYYISNAKLETVQPRYSTYSNEYCWVIDNSTVVQQVYESEPPMLPDVFNFKPYGRIYTLTQMKK